ncbi:MAG: cellulase family glycosylhydrolase [Oscillospiraceae bacterium]
MKLKQILGKLTAAFSAAAIAMTALAYAPAASSDTAFITASAGSAALTGLTGKQLVSRLSVGWNLGNTLECYGDWLSGKSASEFETAWGNPITTKAMIDAVKAEGFTAVRLPVTWYQHINAVGKIDAAWLARVKAVVDYGIDNGMYVILNTHHEDWISLTDADYSATLASMTTVWTGVAAAFKDYDQHLIFEDLNEPRQGEDWTGNATYYKNLNKLNAAFVTLIRASGGNNDERCLMIPGYAASSNAGSLAAVAVPDDANVIVSVHAYTPNNFALAKDGTADFNASGRSDLDTLFSNLNTYFLSKDIPVILGEFGAQNRNNPAERVEWADYYLTKAKAYGVPCFVWDNNLYAGAGELFGYLDRAALTWFDKNVTDAMISAWANGTAGIPAPPAQMTLFSGTGTSNDWGQAVSLNNFNFSNLTAGKTIAVTYSGTKAPELIVQGGTAAKPYDIWAKVSPKSKTATTAVFDCADIIAAYRSDYRTLSGSYPAADFTGATALYIGDTGAALTVTSVLLNAAGSQNLIDISACITGISPSVAYNGTAQRPGVSLIYGTSFLVAGTDYTVTYSDNVAAGTATATVTGIGNYKGTITLHFSITGTAISACTATLSATSYTYDGTPKKPAVTVKNGALTLTAGTDYTVAYSANTAAGTAKVTVTGRNGYSGTLTKTFKITAKSITGMTATLSATNYTDSGAAKKPAVTVKNGATALKSGTDYTVTYKNNTAVGKATVTITGKGNYAGTITKTFKINPKSTAVTLTAGTKKATVKYTKVAGVTGYEIYRATSKTGTYTRVKTTTATSFTNTGLTKGKTYYYKVRTYKTASGAKFYSAYSAVKSVKVK